jgi:hypothetical protein
MKKYLLFAILACLIFLGACKKIEIDTDSTGEAVGPLSLIAPADNNELLLNSADPSGIILFKWTAAKPGINSAVTYKFRLDLKTGDFSAPLYEASSDNSGTATQFSITQTALDALLGTKGIAANARGEFKWMVVASNTKNGSQSSSANKINITRFGIGLNSFTIFAPASSTATQTIDPSAAATFFNFKWQKTVATPASTPVTYKVAFVKKSFDGLGNALAPDFSHALFSIASNNSGVDTFANVSWKQMSDSLTAHGQTDLSVVSQLQWKAIATAGTFSAGSDFYNDLVLLREVKMYLVGSFQLPVPWTPAAGTLMIPDTRTGLSNNMYYAYIYFPAGTDFKFLQGTDWGQPNFGDGGSGILVPNGSVNFHITTAGVYRVSMNKSTLKYDISTGRMGMVGSSQTPTQWDPPTVFPAFGMGFINTNQFLGVKHLVPGGWKLIDNNAWDNGSQLPNETRSYGSTGPSGSDLQVNGPNMPDIVTTGDYRIVWDASDVKHPLYMQMPITEMRIVGNGMTGFADWDPPTAPAMTYGGNGVWTKTLSLIAGKEIKFLAGNAWGAFDYENAGGGKIKYDGGGNFATPATTGTYTVTLNENTGTVTIL